MENSGVFAAPEVTLASNALQRRLALAAACAVGFAFSANYTNHAPLVGALSREFDFNQALAGLLTTGLFLTHATMQIPGGHLVDRLGSRRVLAVAMLVVICGNFAIAFSAAYWHLLAWKIFTGIGTGASFVAGARYVIATQSGPRLNFGQGLYGGSILLGSGFVILALPRVNSELGWRGAFAVTAALAALAWLLWMAAPRAVSRPAASPGSFRGMLLAPQLWLLGLMQMASFGVAIVVGSWIITLLRQNLQLPASRAGAIGSLVLLLGILMRPTGGLLVGRIGARRLIATSLLMNAAGLLILSAGRNSLPLTIGAVLLLGAGCGLPYAALFTRAAAQFPGRAGAAMGLVNMLGILMILVGAPLVGRLADWTGNFRVSFLILACFSLIACAASVVLHSDEPSRSV